MKVSWKTAVLEACARITVNRTDKVFYRDELIKYELKQIVLDTESTSITHKQTLSRILQNLRDDGKIEFFRNTGKHKLIL